MNDELLSEFVTESLEHISDVEPLLLEMETSGLPSMDQMNQIFRAIHSIKGAAGFLGLGDISRLSHSGETLLMKLRDGNLGFETRMADPLLSFVDELRTMLENLPETSTEFPEELLQLIEAISAGEAETEESAAPEQADVQPAPSVEEQPEAVSTDMAPEPAVAELTEDEEAARVLFGEIATDLGLIIEGQVQEVLLAQEQAGGERKPFGETAVLLGLMQADQVQDVLDEQIIRKVMSTQKAAVAEAKQAAKAGSEEGTAKPTQGAQPKKKAKSEARNETIRVNVALLDELMNLAGELVLGRNQLVQTLENVEVAGLKRVLQGIDLVTSDLQEHIMHTRMQPLSVVFDRLPRMVRDISKKVDKAVELTILGKEVELDRSILESLRDPMTHLIRNSMDHGLETTEERAATEKPATGSVVVRAFHQGGQIIVEIEDDGRGIDPEKLRKVSVDRGLYTEEQAAQLTDKEAIYLIFHAGLSTAEKVTSISGRGVGMDVVRSNIQQLGGQIDLESIVGWGTTVRIRLPLTLAIITSLAVSVGQERYVLPQVNLSEILRMKPEELEDRVETLMDVEVMRMRKQLLPIIRLSEVLGIEPEETPDSVSIVVLCTGQQEYGLVVDGLHDNEEIVVKPLSHFLASCKWFAGATILGDGTVAMILDANGISARAGINFDELQTEIQRVDGDGESETQESSRALILFGNGGQEQFALPLREVRRLERISYDEIDYVGQSEFIKHRGKSIPLLRLEHYIPVASSAEEENSLFVIIPNTEGDDVGIVATRIIDTITSELAPETGLLRQPGLLGSNILNGKMTLFLDTGELLETSGLQNVT